MARTIDDALASVNAAITRYGSAVKTDSTAQNALIAAVNNLSATIQSNFNTHLNDSNPHSATPVGMSILTATDAAAVRTLLGVITAGGTVAAANKLATARKINGVAFDGTADITVSAVDQTARDAAAAAKTAADAAKAAADTANNNWARMTFEF